MESQIQDQIRLALGRRDDVVIWRNNVGVAEHIDRNGRPTVTRYGLCPGSADLIGLVRGGRLLALEVKDRGALTPQQRAFGALVNSMGGFWAVVRSVADAEAAVARALAGESSEGGAK